MTLVISLSGYMGSGKDTAADALVNNLGFTKVSFAAPLKEATSILTGLSVDMLNDQKIKQSPLCGHVWPFNDRDGLDDIIDRMTSLVYGYSNSQMRDPVVSMQRTTAYPFDPPALVRLKVRENFHRHIVPILYQTFTDLSRSAPAAPMTPTPRLLLQMIGTEVFRFAYEDTWMEAWKRRALRCERAVATDTRFSNEVRAVRSLGGHVWRIDTTREGVGRSVSHASEREFLTFRYDMAIDNNGSVEDLHKKITDAARQVLSQRERQQTVLLAG